MVAKKIMEILPNRSLYTLIASSTNDEIHMPKHTFISQPSSTFPTIVEPEISCLQSLPNNQPKPSSFGTFSIRTSRNCAEEKKQDETVENDWRNNNMIPEE